MGRLTALALFAAACAFGGCSDTTAPPATDVQRLSVASSCTAPDAFAGTCIASFFGSCWRPAGTCVYDLFDVRWSDGARSKATVDIGAFATGPAHPKVLTVLFSPSGERCATATASETPGCESEVVLSDDTKTLRICFKRDLSMAVTCPDGSMFTAKVPSSCMSASSCRLVDDVDALDGG